MSEPGIEALRGEIARAVTVPYLITVTGTAEPHCADVAVTWTSGDGLAVEAPSSWPGSATAGHDRVSLLWPPAEPGGYSLIVDGRASPGAPGSGTITIAPDKAVLYRSGQHPDRAAPDSACGSDCIPLFRLRA